jgi:type II secretion system protein C
MKSLMSTVIHAPSAPALATLRNLAVLALCLYFLTSGLTSWLEHMLLPAPESRPAVSETADGLQKLQGGSSQPPPDTEPVISRNIFGGDPRPKPDDERDEDVALEEIPLAKNLQNYSLVGTIVNDSGESYAIIKDSRKREQQLLQEGDTLESATIRRILRNNVIIQRDNQEQMLSIDYSARNLMQSSLDSTSRSSEAGASDTVYVDIDKEFIRKSLSDLQSFMKQAQIIPYMQDGDPAGYRLRSIRSGSAFDKLGLQNEDVILSLNGNRIESPDQLLRFRETLTNSDQATLHVLRNDKRVEIEYSLN